MAIKLIANFSKKAGLPGYSSVQYSLTVETEIQDLSAVEAESNRLYTLLQENVDREIQNPGFVPDAVFGMTHNGNGNGSHNGSSNGADHWACSDKQRDLILKVVDENSLDKAEVESLSQDRFGKGVRQLNKLEASGLIDELLERHGGKPARSTAPRNGTRRPFAKGAAR